MSHETIENADRVGLDDELVMIRLELAGHTPRIFELIEGGLVEPYRKCLHAAARSLCHERDDGA